MTINIRHIPRKTLAGHFTIGDHTFYWSYETIIGYANPNARWVRQNVWGPTTGRHIKEHGLSEATKVETADDLNNVIRQGLYEYPITDVSI